MEGAIRGVSEVEWRGGGAYTHVRAELEVASATLDVLMVGVVQVTVDDLFGQRQRPLEPWEG